MRRSKYGARALVVDGERWHSTGEYRRWCELKLLERAGEIGDLQRQVPFALSVNGQKIGDLVVDFRYLEFTRSQDLISGLYVSEDFKGFITPLARWKLKHFEAQYGVKVRITGAASRKRAA